MNGEFLKYNAKYTNNVVMQNKRKFWPPAFAIHLNRFKKSWLTPAFKI